MMANEAMKYPNTPEQLLAQVPGYLTRRQHDIETMIQMAGIGDLKAVSNIAHKIIGNAKGWGFDTLGKLAKETKEYAEKDDPEKTRTTLTKMKQEIDQLVNV